MSNKIKIKKKVAESTGNLIKGSQKYGLHNRVGLTKSDLQKVSTGQLSQKVLANAMIKKIVPAAIQETSQLQSKSVSRLLQSTNMIKDNSDHSQSRVDAIYMT